MQIKCTGNRYMYALLGMQNKNYRHFMTKLCITISTIFFLMKKKKNLINNNKKAPHFNGILKLNCTNKCCI